MLLKVSFSGVFFFGPVTIQVSRTTTSNMLLPISVKDIYITSADTYEYSLVFRGPSGD